MEESFQNGLATNGITVLIVALGWVIVKRLQDCSSGCHTQVFHCESERLKKEERQVELIKRAITEHQRDSQRVVIDITD